MRRVIGFLIVIGAIVSSGSQANAGAGDGGVSAGGDSIDASAALQQFVLGGRPGNWSDPCEDGWNYIGWEHWDVSPTAPAEGPKGMYFNVGFVSYMGRQLQGETYYAGVSWSTCEWGGDDPPPEDGPQSDGETTYVAAYWYPIPPTEELLMSTLFKSVQKQIGKPVLTWPNMNTDGGYVFVRLPMAYTLKPIGFQEAYASVSNELDSASASIRATPTRIDVKGPDSSSSCLVADAMSNHGGDAHPPCYLTFDSVSPGASINVTLHWTITSSVPSPDLPKELTTTSQFKLPVGEIQALVNG